MGRQLPTEIDEYFLIDVILVFLLINYNMPLATIYSVIVIIGSLMYLVPIQFSFFRWLPMMKAGNKLPKLAFGIGAGFAFIWAYNMFATTPMSAIFATTIFGESEILTKLVYSLLIPLVETRFFFRTIMQWWAWKTGDSVHTHPFTGTGIKLMIMFGAVFTLFHATAKGIENTNDLMATLVFGMISVAMILYFQEIIQAIVMHVVVNAKAMGLFETVMAGSSWVVIGSIAAFGYWIFAKNGSKNKFLSI